MDVDTISAISEVVKTLGFPVVCSLALFFLISKIMSMMDNMMKSFREQMDAFNASQNEMQQQQLRIQEEHLKNSENWRATVEANQIYTARKIESAGLQTKTAIETAAKMTDKAIRESAKSNDRVVSAILSAFKEADVAKNKLNEILAESKN